MHTCNALDNNKFDTQHKRTYNSDMRKYKASIYTDGGTRYFDVVFEAEDYWDARRRLDALYGEGNYNYLTEA